MLTTAALAFLVNLAAGLFNWIFQKVGRIGTQVFVFAVALAIAAYKQYGADFPTLHDALVQAAILFSMAVAFYEVLLNRFPMFSGPQA